MNALELVVYPPIPECPQPHWGSFAYEDWFTDRAAEMKLRDRKRLTDAELAAEYHAQQMEAVRAFDRAYPYGESAELDAENARIEVVERFATLPHYDDPTETGNE